MSKKNLCVTFVIGVSVFSFGHKASAVVKQDARTRCEQKHDANACFDAGFQELKWKDTNHRKSAARLLRKACEIQSNKAKCSGKEAKLAARAYLATKDRLPAASSNPVKKAIQAPKIAKSSSRHSGVSNSMPQPDRVAEPPPQPPPPPEFPSAPPPVYESPQGAWTAPCAPGDPACNGQPADLYQGRESSK